MFRVNCIDCLDRTNVVQTAIAKNVIETQLIKLGLIPPEHGIPVNLRLTIQVRIYNGSHFSFNMVNFLCKIHMYFNFLRINIENFKLSLSFFSAVELISTATVDTPSASQKNIRPIIA